VDPAEPGDDMGAPDPVYSMGMTEPDAKSSAPSPAQSVRGLLRSCDRATLATLQRTGSEAPAGWPYASLVLMAVDQDAAPILLISTLADHTRNLLADPRASLLVDGTAGLDEPLTGARATVMGRLEKTDDPRHRARFLARHPAAAMYAGFGDFAVWRMTVGRAHIVAGFGRIHWVDGGAVIGAAPPALAAREADVVDHMNADHADAVDLYATMLLGLDGDGWQMTGVDAEGIDLRRAGRVARLPFDTPVADADGARAELVRLVKKARGLAPRGG
jgi:putative heme iron utilization protein